MNRSCPVGIAAALLLALLVAPGIASAQWQCVVPEVPGQCELEQQFSAELFLAANYQEGNGGVAKDHKQAERLYEKVCDSGVILGCTMLGALYEQHCGNRDYAGCNNLGLLIEDGKAKAIVTLWNSSTYYGGDASDAHYFFQYACEHQVPEGCFNLARLYFSGRGGVTRDLAQGKRQLQAACNAGHPLSCDLQSVFQSVEDIDSNLKQLPELAVK